MKRTTGAFEGVIKDTAADSTPWWPPAVSRSEKRPNVMIVILDDTGWSDLGCFGSEISTPAIDSLAGRGLRYNSFHVTPLCSPTRAVLLSGRNHHSVGMRFLADTDTGFPNSRGSIRDDVELLPQTLRAEGYGTYLVGKWHLAPLHEITPAGPYQNWPLSRGYDRYYGFLDGCVDQYEPELYQDNHPIPVPNREGYHLSEDLADQAIGYLRDHIAYRKDDPFFLHFALGATHAPFQAPREYIDKYVEVFTKGWDETRRDRLVRQIELGLVPAGTELTERNDGVRQWNDLTDDEKTVFSHLQAAFGGFLEHADAQLGRVLDALRDFGELDDTIVILLSDNGASREGGPTGDVDTNAPYSGVRRPAVEQLQLLDQLGGPTGGAHYPEGWAMAGNTPFRQYKQFVDLGGVRSPLILSWPNGPAAAGAVRQQFVHAIDIAPTILELVGLTATDGMDGESIAASLESNSPDLGRATQMWEMMGHRAIWHDGWKAVTIHRQGEPYESDDWRLYNTRDDFSERVNRAVEHPERLRELQEHWWLEARRNDVFPLDDRTLYQAINERGPHGLFADEIITLRPGQGHIPVSSAVTGSNRSITVTAYLRARDATSAGVLLSSGSVQGGYVFYLLGDRLVFEHSSLDERMFCVTDTPLPVGDVEVGFHLHSAEDSTALVELFVGAETVKSAPIPRTSGHLSFWGLDVGHAPVSTFTEAFEAPFPITPGVLDRIEISVRPAVSDTWEYAEALLASE